MFKCNLHVMQDFVLYLQGFLKENECVVFPTQQCSAHHACDTITGDESHAFFNPATCSMTYMRRCDILFLPVFSQAQISKYRVVICQLSSDFCTLHKIYKNWHNLQILYKGNLQKQYHLKALILVHSFSHYFFSCIITHKTYYDYKVSRELKQIYRSIFFYIQR